MFRYSYPESGPVQIEEVGDCELGQVCPTAVQWLNLPPQTGVSSFADDPFTASEFLAHHPCLTGNTG